MAAIIKHGIALLEKGGRHHLQLKGKSLTDSLPLMKEFDKPILDIRINGRGKEGSAYGIKLYTAGNTDPDLAIFGKVDYREKSPILQIRGDYFYGQDYASGRVTLRTGEKDNFLNNSSISNGETLSLKADSKALKAEINANKNALTNLTILLNKLGLNFDLEKELLKIFTGMNDNNNLALKLKELNPFSVKPLNKLDVKPQKIIEPIKTPERDEIKINPHEYFKEDAPTKENNPLDKINKTIKQ